MVPSGHHLKGKNSGDPEWLKLQAMIKNGPIAALKREIAEIRAANKKLEGDHARLQAEFDKSQVDGQTARSEQEETKANLKKTNRELQASIIRSKAHEKTARETKAELEETKKQLKATDKRLESMQADLDKANAGWKETNRQLEAAQLQIAENAEAQDFANAENAEAFTEIVRRTGIDWSESAVLSAICLRTLLDKAQARTAVFIGIGPNVTWRQKLDEAVVTKDLPPRTKWAKKQITEALQKKGKAGAETKAFSEMCGSPKALEILVTPSSIAPARFWGNKYAHNLPNRAEVEKIVDNATLDRKQLTEKEQEGYKKLVAVVFAGANSN
ncbi:hypothetical protein CPC08DRAFT_549613 [Agrocybe pediades]|nr:hypothetical protein CPC08DRAFT_549613 [Agrocybe pediades]